MEKRDQQPRLDGASLLLLFVIALVALLLAAILQFTGGFDFTVFL